MKRSKTCEQTYHAGAWDEQNGEVLGPWTKTLEYEKHNVNN